GPRGRRDHGGHAAVRHWRGLADGRRYGYVGAPHELAATRGPRGVRAPISFGANRALRRQHFEDGGVCRDGAQRLASQDQDPRALVDVFPAPVTGRHSTRSMPYLGGWKLVFIWGRGPAEAPGP